ncbi:hypothetical protein D3C73_1481800 [compost metagenome]
MTFDAKATTVNAQTGTLRFTAINIAEYFTAVHRGDQRSHFIFRRLVKARPDAQRRNLLFQSGTEFICRFIADGQDDGKRHAAFPCRAISCAHNGAGGHLHVGIRH